MQLSRTVSFNHPFKLPGMSDPFRAGTYEVLIERIPLDVSWDAFRTSMTLLLKDGQGLSAWPVTTDELEAALSSDRAHDTKDGFS